MHFEGLPPNCSADGDTRTSFGLSGEDGDATAVRFALLIGHRVGTVFTLILAFGGFNCVGGSDFDVHTVSDFDTDAHDDSADKASNEKPPIRS
jgi:hypothetical protein